MFSFAWSQLNSALGVTLISPSHCVYIIKGPPSKCPDIVDPVIDLDFQIITFSIPGVAKVCTTYN